MASIVACLIASGTGKSGCPMERLIGFLSFAPSSNTLRMPEVSTTRARSLIIALKSIVEGMTTA